MKALVTGANGLIGSNLVRALIQQGYEVRAFVRETSNLQSLKDLPVELAYGDLLEPATLKNAVSGCKIIFHVAAVFSYWGHTAQQLKSIAGQGTANLIEAAKQAGITKITLTSSSAVLGSSREPKALNENHSVDSSEFPSPYVSAKVEQEKVAFKLAKKFGIDLISICPTVTVGGPDYGLTESNRIIVNYLQDPFRATWIGGGNIIRAKDVAEGHILAAEKGTPGTRYILASENLDWSEIHRIISELCGIDGPFMEANHTFSYLAATAYELAGIFSGKRPPTTRHQAKMVGRYFWYSNKRIRKLGFKPKTSRHALAEAVSWLVTSDHVPVSLRSKMSLSEEIYEIRQEMST